jgi:hypothetical protein
MNNVQERLTTGLFAGTSPDGASFSNDLSLPMEPSIGQLGGDRVSNMLRPQLNEDGLFGQAGSGFSSSLTGGILSQLISIISQLVSGLFGSGTPMQGQASPQTYFQNATASSTGDPHLAFNGTAAGGVTNQTHYDSMSAHNDLLDSNSFRGGFQIATSVTQPDANGVTYNQQATISTGFGATQVSLDNAGNATILQNGQSIALADGQTLQLDNGETVARNTNGSVVVTDRNRHGGSITTTLSENGHGVDVNVQSQDVGLGGDLVNQATGMG